MIKIYGIKNCDTVKKALNWLEENDLKYQFHDYKKEGVSENKLQEFIQKFSWQKTLNSKSRTFRQLDEALKPTNQSDAITLMQKETSTIKRPILISDSIYLLGFNAEEYQKSFSKK
jgi:arsenate reductase